MAEKIGFFTPVFYGNSKTFLQKVEEKIDRYFFFGGRVATVIDSKKFDGMILVEYSPKEKVSTVAKVIKIASYFLFAIPLLVIKGSIRLFRSYQVVKPHELIAEFKKIVESNLPTEKAKQRERKKELLATAYAIAVFNQTQCAKVEKPSMELALTFGEILSRYAILVYGDKSVKEDFEVSKQLLFGALNAQLYAVGALDRCFEFSAAATKSLSDLPVKFLDTRPFRTMEATFMGLDSDTISVNVDEAKLSDGQRTVLSQTLRYINGAQRHIVWKAERLPNDDEKRLATKLLTLAKKAVENRVEGELWELCYNDFPHYYKDVTGEVKEIERNWEWLRDHAKTFLERCRLANKSAKDVAQAQEALKYAKAELKKHLDPITYAKLDDILERNDVTHVSSVATKLEALNRPDLPIDWFAVLPSNLAHALIRENRVKETKGLLSLSKAIVYLYEQKGIKNHRFVSIKHNFYLRELLSLVAKAKDTLEKEKGGATAQDFAVSLTQLGVKFRDLSQPLQDWIHYLEEMMKGDREPRESEKEAHKKAKSLQEELKLLQKDAGAIDVKKTSATDIGDLIQRSITAMEQLYAAVMPPKDEPAI